MLGSTWALGFLVFVASWPVTSLAPTTGLDPSWQAALHMAAHDRVGFGDELNFSYGPLGFLNFPLLYYPFTAGLAVIHVVAVQLGLSLSLLWAARRTMPLPFALAFAFVAASTLSQDAVVVPVLVWCVAALQGSEDGLARRLLPLGGGLVAGIEVLGKLNVGATVLALFLVAVLALPNRRRALSIFVPSLLGTFLAAWFATGGSVSELGSYARNAASIVSGYSSAMGYEHPPTKWWFPLAVPGLVVAGFVAAHRSSSGLGRRQAGGALALWAVFAFMSFKAGFVRADGVHKALFFSVMLGGLFAFGWRPATQLKDGGRGSQLAAVLSLSGAIALFFGATDARFSDVVEPGKRADHAFEQLKTMLGPNRRHDVIESARASMQQAYALDAHSLRLVGNRRVHVYPHETAAAWAYHLNWRPLPVFQTYSAYTERVDKLNADALASSDGPEVILRRPERAIDDRNGTFDSPAAVLAMVCHYEEVRATRTWEVLRRVGNRCGAPRLMKSVRLSLGDEAEVPSPRRPDELVFGRLSGIEPSGRERVRALVYKARDRIVAINGLPFRFVPGTAEDGLLLSIPPKADYSGPYGFSKFNGIAAGNASTVSFFRERPNRSQPGGRRLELEFYAMPIRRQGATRLVGAEPSSSPG